MQSAQILKWHLHKFLTYMTVVFERQVSSPELLLLLDFPTPQKMTKKKKTVKNDTFLSLRDNSEVTHNSLV